MDSAEQSSVSPRTKQQQKSYIQQNLYKPKVRTDKSTEQYEFERNSQQCSFKPYIFTKKDKYNDRRAKQVVTNGTLTDRALIRTHKVVSNSPSPKASKSGSKRIQPRLGSKKRTITSKYG